jgi:predicted molibdopterin-dependent oxidoreductase YjgC
MKEFITACPCNCYSTCSFRVHVEDNKITRILPYSVNLATPEGPCIKGLSYIERSKSKERITSPLRKSEKGTFVKISMNEALEYISDNLKRIKNLYGSKDIRSGNCLAVQQPLMAICAGRLALKQFALH